MRHEEQRKEIVDFTIDALNDCFQDTVHASVQIEWLRACTGVRLQFTSASSSLLDNTSRTTVCSPGLRAVTSPSKPTNVRRGAPETAQLMRTSRAVQSRKERHSQLCNSAKRSSQHIRSCTLPHCPEHPDLCKRRTTAHVCLRPRSPLR